MPTPSCTSGETRPSVGGVNGPQRGPHHLVCFLQLHGRLTGHQTCVRALPVCHHHIWGKDPSPPLVPSPPVWGSWLLPSSAKIPPAVPAADPVPTGHLPQDSGLPPCHPGNLHHDAGPGLPLPHGAWERVGAGPGEVGRLSSLCPPLLLRQESVTAEGTHSGFRQIGAGWYLSLWV